MAKQTLTDIALQKLQPVDGRQIETWDAKMPGFGVRVSPSGTKSFILVYRHDGRSRRLTLGRYPILSLGDARKLAHKALAKVAEGADPVVEKKSHEERKLDVFAAVVDEFVRLHCNRHNRENTARETERLLKAEFVPKWRKRDIKTIAKADVIRVIDAIVERGSPGAAHHAFAAIRKFFNWCVERGLIDASPCTGLKSPTKQKPRDRVLNDDELVRVWRAATQIGYPVGPITQLLILTGQRRGEVAGMRWSDIDFTEALWTLPGELTKNARPHQVPLSQKACRIISSLPQLDDLYVFPARGQKQQPFMGFNKGKLRLDAASGVDGWTFHDLRRTAATGMAQLGVAPHVVERVLNHVSGTFGGVVGIYNRFGYLLEMRAALDAWDARVKELLER